MIQRKQTLWLLLSLICGLLTFKFPFFNGTIMNDTSGIQVADLNATNNIFLLTLTVLCVTISILAMFLFKDRKLQVRLVFIGLILAVGLIALYFYYMQNFQPGGHISLSALFNLFIVVGFFFALKGIRNDQKLVRDLDRLR